MYADVPGPAPLASEVHACLGPTNTGKTFHAIERMLEHGSGMMGLPLRLLAREVYDKVSSRVGEAQVALVTGEEKRIPAHPRYWVCTVEAMPVKRTVDFVAVDEIQLAAHRERGHVFTDRLLTCRGRRETWFLGSDIARPLIEKLVPTARVLRRPRLSTLADAGRLTMGALPPRSAVIAFSVPKVYELAERLRARRGGAAVVLGALSPRTRNAQVAMYQSGEVDYLVATDAVGMGLNMDVDVVAFADTRKFDGRQARSLDEAELAQIAGRAGRHHRNGRFATLDPVPAFDPNVVRAIERHRFAALERFQWRHSDLDFTTVDRLIRSLRRPPQAALAAWLTPAPDAIDLRTLMVVAQRPEITARVRTPEHVALLWSLCQIPDFRNGDDKDHAALVGALFRQLTDGPPQRLSMSRPHGRLSHEWIERRVAPLENTVGDLDSLLARLAAVRTWTYVTQREDWVPDAQAWQARTRAVEDRLSDALHAQLMQRFVDAGGRRRPRAPTPGGRGSRTLADQLRVQLGPSFFTEGSVDGAGVGSQTNHAFEAFCEAAHDRFVLDSEGRIQADDRVLARLQRGVDLFHPEVTLTDGWAVGAGVRLRLHRRLVAWIRDAIADLLAPLRTPALADLSPGARGLVYTIERTFGVAARHRLVRELSTLAPADRPALRRAGIRVGRHVVYHPRALRPPTLPLRAALMTAYERRSLRPPAAHVTVFRPEDVWSDLHYEALGFPIMGAVALRADRVESTALALDRGIPDADLAARLGCDPGLVMDLRRTWILR